MSVEDLLKPRYKVIAEYPNSPFDIDEILSVYKGNNYVSNLDAQIYTDRCPEKYPAIFRKLEWWEERDEKDMPEYVKREGEVFKVKEWLWDEDYEVRNSLFFTTETDALGHYPRHDFLPATEQEYLNYKQNQQ